MNITTACSMYNTFVHKAFFRKQIVHPPSLSNNSLKKEVKFANNLFKLIPIDYHLILYKVDQWLMRSFKKSVAF